MSEKNCIFLTISQIVFMPTDGADFKRRVKYHGRTYIEIKNGSNVATVACFGTAGLAREILGDNPIPDYKELILATVNCLQGIFSNDRESFRQDLSERLNVISNPQVSSVAQQLVVNALIREAGKILSLPSKLGQDSIMERLFSATGRELHEELVIACAGQYAMQHRQLSLAGLNDFEQSWKDVASDRLTEMMRDMFDNGKLDRKFTRARPEMAPLKSDSLEDLNTCLMP